MTDETSKPTDVAEPFPIPTSTTSHSLETSAGTLSYQAQAGWMTLRKIHKPVAQIFHTAYTTDAAHATQRPITFVFNGGPGAASAYLHMGALGPKRVAFGPNGTMPPPPVQMTDNQETWLPFSDLVFIDPVGTGFSRAMKDADKSGKSSEGGGKQDQSNEENPEFWKVDSDLDSLGEFIRRYLSTHHRWTSPIFIAGESYGGFRVAKMARTLQEKHGVGLCGALLISPAIEFDSLLGSDYNLMPWIELFPSLAASAHFHGKVASAYLELSPRQLLVKAEEFALNDLAKWLAHGDALPPDEHQRIVSAMSDLVGLSKDFLANARGRVTATTFCRELLREQRRLCGHYDAAVTVVDPYPHRANYEGPHPTLFSIDRLFSGSINHHLRTTLQVETELDYRLLSFEVNLAWKNEGKEGVFRKAVGALDDLRYGMSLNEHMKVMITHGHFDLITPYFSSGRLIEQMKLSPEQRANLVHHNYPGGHMYYSWDQSRQDFLQHVHDFYRSAIPSS